MINYTSRDLWLRQLSDVVTEPMELLRILSLDQSANMLYSKTFSQHFPLRVPRTFITRMQTGNAQDPLLLQVLTSRKELINSPDYLTDPLQEHYNTKIPGLLHKYHNRALLLIKGGCAVNCRYCFRRYFPYWDHNINKNNWNKIIEYLKQHSEIDEIIFSGGDPLMAKDYQLYWMIRDLEKLTNLKKLRIHSRLPVVIPSRITLKLCQIFEKSRLKIILVTHINHPQEIDNTLVE